jgi:hypothetical protein
MTLYFLGRRVETEGDCDDGWVWGIEPDAKRPSYSWYWATQLDGVA